MPLLSERDWSVTDTMLLADLWRRWCPLLHAQPLSAPSFSAFLFFLYLSCIIRESLTRKDYGDVDKMILKNSVGVLSIKHPRRKTIN